jgi:hypothetical protein
VHGIFGYHNRTSTQDVPSSEILLIDRQTDMASNDPLHQNLPLAHPAPYLPNGLDRRLIPHGVPPLPLFGPFPAHGPTTLSPPTFPARETAQPTLLRHGLLHWGSPHCRLTDRYVDKMVSG